MPVLTPPKRIVSPFTLGALTAFAALTPRHARAQSRAADVAAAQSLFDDARALVRAGRFAEACPKLEESERLDAGPGTEFNLADCYEREGRSASAWAQFTAVADSLRALGQRDRERVSRDRAKALEPTLSKLTVNVSAAARVTGLEVKRDGELLGAAQWGSGVPVDPGEHAISASAPGMEPWEQKIEIRRDRRTAMVDVHLLQVRRAPQAPHPALLPSSAPAPLASAPPAATTVPEAPAGPSRSRDGQKIAALVTGAVGIAGLGIGAYFGSQAIAKHNEYAPECPNNLCTGSAAVELHDAAASDATIATVTVTVSAVAVVGAALLWFTAPSQPRAERSRGVQITPSVAGAGGRSAGLTLKGSW